MAIHVGELFGHHQCLFGLPVQQLQRVRAFVCVSDAGVSVRRWFSPARMRHRARYDRVIVAPLLDSVVLRPPL